MLLLMVGAGLQKLVTVKDNHYETYKELVDNFPYPAAIVLPSEHVDHCNQHLIDFLGYELWELRERSFGDYTPPEFKDKDEHLFRAVVSPQNALENYRMTKAWFHKDGHLAWGHMTVIPVMNDEREVLYTIAWVKPTETKDDEDMQTPLIDSTDKHVQMLQVLSNSKKMWQVVIGAVLLILSIALAVNLGDVIGLLK